MKTKKYILQVLLILLNTFVFADYSIDFENMLSIRHAEPFVTDKINYSPSDITDTDKMVYSSVDFQIEGKGRGSDLDLMFARYYNNKLNNDGVCGYSFKTNLDINLQIINGLYTVSDEKGELHVFNQYYSYPQGMIFNTVSKPNPHSFLETADYYIFQKKYGNKYCFNKTTKLIEKIVDRNGNVITYVRDEFNKVTSLLDNSGREIIFTYNASDKIETAKDPMDRIYTYAYDTNNNLITVTDPLINITSFEYQCPLDIHNISRITKPKGNHQSFEYNQDDQLTKVYDNNIEIWSITHNADVDSTQITNAVGLQVLKMKLENGKIITTTDNFGIETDELDDNGYLSKYTDKLNHVTTMTRDTKGNVISMLNARGNTTTQTFNTLNKVTQMVSPMNLIENFQYDSKGNLLKYINGEGGEWILTYNLEGLPLTLKDPNQKITTFEYDTYGNLRIIIDPEGGIREYTYDLCGNALTYKDPNGNIYSYLYDLLNRTIQVTNPDSTLKTISFDSNGLISTLTNEKGDTVTYTFNTFDKLESFTDEENNMVQYTYDTIGRLQSQTDPKGFIYGFEYDARDRLTKKIFPDGSFIRYEYAIQSNSKVSDAYGLRPSKITDQMNNIFTFQYNELYAKVKTIDPLNKEITKVWDELDRVKEIIDQNNNSTKFEFNKNFNVISVENAMNKQKLISYDLLGNILSYTDEENHTTGYQYNGVYENIGQTNALGKNISFQRDLNGNLTSILDQKGNPIAFQYDNRNRLIKEIDAENHETQYFYDNLNNIIKTIRAEGTEVLFEYYKNGLLKKITYPTNKTVSFEYDSNRNLTKMIDWIGETYYFYDNKNQVIEIIKPENKKIKYTYNANGVVTELNLTDLNNLELYKINYTIDAMSRVSNISDSNNTSIQFTFDANGKRLSEVLSNGSVTSYSYNSINNLTKIKTVNSLEQVLLELKYTHDNTGNILSETNETGFQKTYSYDAIYQLSGVNYTGGEFINYTYDDAGNRLTQNTNGSITNYSYNNLNQLMQSIENAVTTQYNYNLNGNLIQTVNPSQTINYQYNFMNKVEYITKTGLENISLTMNYNGLGHRVNKTYSDGKTYSYLYSGNNILEETSNQYTGGVAYYLMGGIDEVFARIINNSPEFYLKDNLNSLRKVIDNTQGILNTADYEPFGSIRNGDTGSHNYLFTGREKDFGDSYYYRARTYSTISGTFQQKDPIGVLGGLNLYGYCGNNVINSVDPLGLWKKKDHINLTSEAMSNSGFNENENSIATASNTYVDRIKNQNNNTDHSMPGYEDEAKQDAQNHLNDAVESAKNGDWNGAMQHLGEGLHTVQDAWAHSEEDLGWMKHILPGYNADDPNYWAANYNLAEYFSEKYLQEFLEKLNQK